MAIEIFGVDQTFMQAYLPQVGMGTNYPITTARLTTIIEGAASQLYSALTAAYGSGIIGTITADTTSPVYSRCQTLIRDIAMPHILRAAHHISADIDFEFYDELAKEARKDLRKDPLGEIGQSSTGMSPNVETSTKYLDLDVASTDKIRARRKYDDRGHGKDEGGFVW